MNPSVFVWSRFSWFVIDFCSLQQACIYIRLSSCETSSQVSSLMTPGTYRLSETSLSAAHFSPLHPLPTYYIRRDN